MRNYTLDHPKQELFKLTEEQRKTLVKSKHGYANYDYIDRVEKTESSHVLFVRKKRISLFPVNRPASTGRGTVRSFSRKSWLRMVEHSIRFSHKPTSFITLTYHDVWPSSYHQSKHDLRTFLNWLTAQGATHYFWALEFQKRGAPHYHIWCDVSPSHDSTVKTWQGITQDPTITRCEVAPLRKSIAHYICKEMSKRYQKVAPHGWHCGRMWGHSKVDLLPLVKASTPPKLDAKGYSIIWNAENVKRSE